MDRENALRATLVQRLTRAGLLRSPSVTAALLAVARHRFVPEVGVEQAYADAAIALLRDGEDVISSISQPSMIVEMLELLEVRPGNRVLEIGTGSGYNAALLAELAGPRGSVVSVELDPAMSRRAGAALSEAGYGRVRLLVGDGAAFSSEAGAFDRISVTARCEDIAEAWWAAMRERGRLVIPLLLRPVGEFVVGFERSGERLRGVGAYPCAFIALRGESARESPERVFFRDAERGDAPPSPKTGIGSIVAVRSRDATPEFLDEADVVVARPVTMFGVRFSG